MRNRADAPHVLLGFLFLAVLPGHAVAGANLSDMLASSAAAHATAVSGPILSVSPLSHDYGVQDNGTHTVFNFTLTNIGDQDLHINPPTSSDLAFSVATYPPALGPGSAGALAIDFNPTDGQFHIEPGLRLRLRAPNLGHLGRLIPFDHAEIMNQR